MCNIFGAGNVGPRFYINDGGGRFRIETNRIPAEITSLQRKFTSSLLVDVDRNGQPDLVLGAHPGTNQPRDVVLLNDGKGFFSYTPDTTMPLRHADPNWGTVNIVSGDLDSDGWPDLFVSQVNADYTNSRIQLLLNRPRSSSVSPQPIVGFPAIGFLLPSSVGPQSAQAVRPVLFGTVEPSRTFVDVTERLSQTSPIGSPGQHVWARTVVPADFNGDNRIDFAVHLNSGPPRLFMNLGDANFGDFSSALPTSRTGRPDATALAAGDFDNDGRTDLFILFGNSQVFARNVGTLGDLVDYPSRWK